MLIDLILVFLMDSAFGEGCKKSALSERRVEICHFEKKLPPLSQKKASTLLNLVSTKPKRDEPGLFYARGFSDSDLVTIGFRINRMYQISEKTSMGYSPFVQVRGHQDSSPRKGAGIGAVLEWLPMEHDRWIVRLLNDFVWEEGGQLYPRIGVNVSYRFPGDHFADYGTVGMSLYRELDEDETYLSLDFNLGAKRSVLPFD